MCPLSHDHPPRYVFIVILVGNHLLLAHFGRQNLRQQLQKPISDDPNEVI